MELIAWYNLIYWTPILFGLAYALISGIGDMGDANHDVDMEVGDAHIHIPEGLHVDGQVVVHGDHTHDVEGGSSASGWDKVLSAIGLGRIPVTLVIQAFLFLFGIIGFGLNLALRPYLVHPEVYLWFSFPAALIGGVVGTSLLARPLGRLLPKNESFSSNPASFLGQGADAFYRITGESGAVRITDEVGFPRELKVRLLPGEPDPIEKGERILLTHYDPINEIYFARRHPNAPRQLGS